MWSEMTTDPFSPDSGPRWQRRSSKLSAVGRTIQSSSSATNYYSSPDWWRLRADVIKALKASPESLVAALRTLNALKALKDFQSPDFENALRRTYRRSLQELYRLRGTRLQNEPTEPAKSPLNGKEQALNGDQKQENPTHEHICIPEFKA